MIARSGGIKYARGDLSSYLARYNVDVSPISCDRNVQHALGLILQCLSYSICRSLLPLCKGHNVMAQEQSRNV